MVTGETSMLEIKTQRIISTWRRLMWVGNNCIIYGGGRKCIDNYNLKSSEKQTPWET
jgi:hypothetical protein